MYYGFVDYSVDEVRDLTLFFEQYVRYENKSPHYSDLIKILAILRGVNKIKKGTRFLSEMSGTSGAEDKNVL